MKIDCINNMFSLSVEKIEKSFALATTKYGWIHDGRICDVCMMDEINYCTGLIFESDRNFRFGDNQSWPGISNRTERPLIQALLEFRPNIIIIFYCSYERVSAFEYLPIEWHTIEL